MSPRFCFFAGLLLVLADSSAAADDSALLQASRNGNAQIAIGLTQSGADVHQTGPLGETALHWAAFNGSHALARLLIERGADVNARVQNGNTPLHQAAYRGHLQVVDLLVSNGAKVGVLNQRGLTAAEWALQNKHDGVYQYLVAHGGGSNRLVSQTRGAGKIRLAAKPRPKPRQFVETQAQVPAAQQTVRARFPGLSMQLGELPSLVMRIADASGSAAPALRAARALGPGPEDAHRGKSSAASRGLANKDREAISIQLGAFSTPVRAQAHWRATVKAHADLLEGRKPVIAAARSGADRTVHRLRLGPLSFGEATRMCAAFVARKFPCLVVSGRQQ